MSRCPRCGGAGWYRKDGKVLYCRCLTLEAMQRLKDKFPPNTQPDSQKSKESEWRGVYIALSHEWLGGLLSHALTHLGEWEEVRYILGYSLMNDYFTKNSTIDEENTVGKVIVEVGGHEVPNRILGNVFLAFVRARALLQKQTFFVFRRPFSEALSCYGLEVEKFFTSEVVWIGKRPEEHRFPVIPTPGEMKDPMVVESPETVRSCNRKNYL